MEPEIGMSCFDLTKQYASVSGPVGGVTDITATFARGQITAVVGASGSGKSTLLRLLAGLDRPSAGSVFVGFDDLSTVSRRRMRSIRRTKMSYVFQNPAANLIEYMTVAEHLEFTSAQRSVTVDSAELLGRFGLAHRSGALPNQMSSGEQQRLAFAMATVGEPTVVLADEPTAELDAESAATLLETFDAMSQSGASVVIASHDDAVMEASDQLLRLSEGKLLT